MRPLPHSRALCRALFLALALSHTHPWTDTRSCTRPLSLATTPRALSPSLFISTKAVHRPSTWPRDKMRGPPRSSCQQDSLTCAGTGEGHVHVARAEAKLPLQNAEPQQNARRVSDATRNMRETVWQTRRASGQPHTLRNNIAAWRGRMPELATAGLGCVRTLYVASRAAPRAAASRGDMLFGRRYEKTSVLITGKSAYVYATPFKKKVARFAAMSWCRRARRAACSAEQLPGDVSTSWVTMSCWLRVAVRCWRRDRRPSSLRDV